MRTGVFYKSDQYGVKLKDIDPEIKNQLATKLAEKRVIHHIPSDQSGAHLELNQWRVDEVLGDPENPATKVLLKQKSTEIKDGKRIYKHKNATEKAGKLIGLHTGKLSKNKAVLIIKDNFGMCVAPELCIIPHHDVPVRLAKLRKANNNEPLKIIRNGMIIRIASGVNTGDWRVFSAMGNMMLKVAALDYPSYDESRPLAKKSSIKPLIKAGLEIVNCSLTGNE